MAGVIYLCDDGQPVWACHSMSLNVITSASATLAVCSPVWCFACSAGMVLASVAHTDSCIFATGHLVKCCRKHSQLNVQHQPAWQDHLVCSRSSRCILQSYSHRVYASEDGSSSCTTWVCGCCCRSHSMEATWLRGGGALYPRPTRMTQAVVYVLNAWSARITAVPSTCPLRGQMLFPIPIAGIQDSSCGD